MSADDDLAPSRLARFGLGFILITFAGLGIWAATAPIQGAVIVSGLVKTEGNRKTVQHNEGGIVKAILVRDGDSVKQGQTLIVLEDASVSASFHLVRGNLDAELARQARFEAEATGQGHLAFPEELRARERDAEVMQLIKRERCRFETRRRALAEQIRLIESQIEDIQREHLALGAQLRADEGAGKSAQEEQALYETLREQQFISTARLLAQQRLVAEYQARQEQRRAEMARAEQRIKEMRLQIIALRNDYSKTAAEGLKDSSVRLNELRERLLPSQDALARQTIIAPAQGRVLGLRVHTPGASIGPREPLLDIVPDAAAPVIAAQTGVDNIKQLHLGQTAEVRFTALPYRSTPLVLGKLSYISPDALIDEKTGVPSYQVHIVPDAQSLHAAGITTLQPGMAAEAYIQTQARTTLDYLLQPITGTLARALREQ